jgi:hypothetical protein
MSRGLARALLAAALAALLWGARPDRPPGQSLAALRRFWGADARTRLYNSALLVADRPLGRELLRADAAIPLSADVRLCVSMVDEETRRTAAFVLSPRRVFVVPGCAAPSAVPFR